MEREPSDITRRNFLTLAGVGAGAAGAAVGLAASTAKAAPATEPGPDGTEIGYRETEHVKRYYALARM